MAQDFLSALVKGVDHDSELAEELQQEALLPEVNNKTLTMYYLGVYSALAVGNSLITLIRAFLFAFAGIRAAKYVHDKLLKSVLYVSIFDDLFESG